MTSTRPHYLLDGRAGWRPGLLNGTDITDDGNLTLQPLPGSARPLVDATGSLGGFEAAIGVAVDAENRVYVLDGRSCRVKRFDPCSQQFHELPCIGGRGWAPRQFEHPRGMTISCRDELMVADTGNHRVQIFSLHGLALRNIWGPFIVRALPSGSSVAPVAPQVLPTEDCSPHRVYPAQTWEPWDVATSAAGWTYVSDYANGLIHAFDPAGRWHAASTGAGDTQPPLIKPTRLAVDKEGRIYVLQEGSAVVVVLDAAGKYLGQVTQPGELRGRFCPVAVAIDVEGHLCLSDCVTRRVYFYQPVGDGTWCGYRCNGCIDGHATSLIFDLQGNPVIADGGAAVCQLAPQAAYPLTGQFYSAALDSKTYQCVWHRVVLRAAVPAGCTIRVDTFTAEAAKSVDEIASLAETRWSTGQVDVNSCDWDCLVQAPPGRYLWLRLTLSGEGAQTPCVERIKIYYPRASSLQYLPGVFREDPVSADFLSRFLSIFDTLRQRNSSTIDWIARYFDPLATPAACRGQGTADFLSWLASWLGLSLDTNWPVDKRRELVRQAPQLFKLRGMPAGLRLHIKIFSGVEPRILEMYRLRRWLLLDQSTLGNNSTVFGDDVTKRLQVGANSTIGRFQLIDYGDPALDAFNEYAYQFLVVVPRWPGATADDEQTLQQIIDLAKPAHTVGTLQWAEPRMRIGVQAFIGVDTVIGRYPVGVIEGQGQLGYDTVLGTPGRAGAIPDLRVGRTSRVGGGAVLN